MSTSQNIMCSSAPLPLTTASGMTIELNQHLSDIMATIKLDL